MTAALIAVFAVWFALSAANAVPALRRRLTGTLNAFCALPPLALFAPEPLDVDYHLVWRDHRADLSHGEWHEIAMAPVRRWRAISNPASRDLGALQQIVSALSVLDRTCAPAARNGERIILVSLPYLALLQVVLAQPRTPGAVARQFAIIETSGFGVRRRAALGIASPLHALEPA